MSTLVEAEEEEKKQKHKHIEYILCFKMEHFSRRFAIISVKARYLIQLVSLILTIHDDPFDSLFDLFFLCSVAVVVVVLDDATLLFEMRKKSVRLSR